MDFSFTEDQNAIRDLANQIFGDRASDEFLLGFDRTEDTYDEPLWTTWPNRACWVWRCPKQREESVWA